MNNQSIIQYAKSRHIEDCVHFTNVLNLKSIINYGLLPKSTLKEESMNFQENDVYRYDGFENATSLSITFPNYKMFYSIRTQDTSKNWAVLYNHLWRQRLFHPARSSATFFQCPVAHIFYS